MFLRNWLDALKRKMRITRNVSGRPSKGRSHRTRRNVRPWLELLEERELFAADFGDAPDLTAGTGQGDYQTLLANNGPQHTIVANLRMGATVDGEADALPNVTANGDDVNQALPDDEDGLVFPQGDLNLTVGTAPTVNVYVMNTTGTAATLYGWIDYNADGVFDNTTERASAAVPDGSNNFIKTLTFPVVPSGFFGPTSARFRLSTDSAAQNPTGAASDGEVEDYIVTIATPSDSTAASANTIKIASGTNGGPTLADGDRFGRAVAALGDLDGDGVADLAVGAYQDDTGGVQRGAVYVQFLNADGTVQSTTKIASGTNGGPTLVNGDLFGVCVASVGDLDGDGVADLAVGARGDETGGNNHGAVHVLLLNANGTVKSSTKIADSTNGGPTLANYDNFGNAVAALGDLDGDGVTDLAVGAYRDDTGGFSRGAVYVLLLNANGTVKSSTKIASGQGGGPTLVDLDSFGTSVAPLGDLDGDGVTDLAVGAYGDDTGGGNRGAVHVLLLHANGTVKSSTKIASGLGGGPTLANNDYFGASVVSVGDLDGDGVTDLAVGAYRDDTGGSARGAVHLLLLNADGTVKSSSTLASGTAGGPTLADTDFFGASVASLGDINGDGLADLAIGADGDDTGGSNRGAVHILVLNPALDLGDAPDSAAGTGANNYNTLSTDNGPSHGIVSSLGIGAHTDPDSGALQNLTANADDVDGALPDDEDGLAHPLDLTLTIGTVPQVRVYVHNTTGTAATLSGWIDFNHNGIFDNPAERAQLAIPNNTLNGIATLTFAAVPTGFTGKTYARFRLGTTAAAQDPTGPAPDGEVEDYTVTITEPSDGTADSTKTTKIAHNINGGPTLADLDVFGSSLAALGDWDGDGVGDQAVGAVGDANGTGRGAVYVQFLNTNGTVKSSIKIADSTNGGPTLSGDDNFGSGVTAVGDLDGNGVTDLAVGANQDDTAGPNRGAVHVLFMNADRTVLNSVKLANGANGVPTLSDFARFGTSVAALGDLDGDGVNDLAVGADSDDTGGTSRGAVFVLFMNSDGTVKSHTKIAHALNGGPTLANDDNFGIAVTALGDLDGDGFTDLAVGAHTDDTGATNSGAVHVLFLNADGTVRTSTKIAHQLNGGPSLAFSDRFGRSVAAVGDLDGDGIPDLAVGSYRDDTGGSGRGAVYLFFLNANGTVKSSTKIADNTNGGPTLANNDYFGNSVAALGDLNGDGLTDLSVGAYVDDTGGTNRGAVYVLFLQPQRDFGDAPDTAVGTGASNYNTLLADNGPVHLIVPGLRLGASVDADSGTLQNLTGNADDVDGALADDEDGLVHPLDLTLTVGAAPQVRLYVHNTTGTVATLSGWIDFNHNGVFENATERAQVAIPDNTLNGIATLTFAAVPTGFPGKTYARFRLGTTAAATGPTGAASDGEVEDYVVTITAPSDGTADPSKTTKIADNTNGGPGLANGDQFGKAVEALGDLDGDGITDLAVGAFLDDTGGSGRGAVYVQFLNLNGTVKSSTKIASATNGGPTLANDDLFGVSVTALGDLDGDGVTDLAVGAIADDTGGNARGAVYVLLLNADGTVKSSTKIAHNINGGPSLSDFDQFGSGVTDMGDFDGDGVTDLAVGAYGDSTGGGGRGAVYLLLLNANGTVKSSTKIAHATNGGPTLANDDLFGSAVAALGDLDGDGITDLAVGTFNDDTGGSGRGAVFVLLLNANGTVKSSTKIGSGANGGPPLADDDNFGKAVAALGDLDGDGVADLAVGAYRDDTGGGAAGAMHVLLLNADGTVKSKTKIASGTGGGPMLASSDYFGGSVAALGDLNGDGLTDLAVGAYKDDTGGDGRGAVHVLFLKPVAAAAVPQPAAAENLRSYQTITNRNLRANRRRGLLSEFGRAAGRRVKVQLLRGPEVGKLRLRKNGSFVYTPPRGFTGDVTFLVRRFDGAGLNEQVTVVLHVKPRPRLVRVLPGQTLAVSAEEGLLRDVVSFEHGLVTVQLVQGPSRGDLDLKRNGAFTFAAPPDFRGSTSFLYQLVIDGVPGAVGRVTLTTRRDRRAERIGSLPA